MESKDNIWREREREKKKRRKKKKNMTDWTIIDETVYIYVSFTPKYIWFKHILFPKYDDHTCIDDIYTNDRIRTEA